MNDIFKRAPHNPPHLFLPKTLYMLTASTYLREPLMLSSKRKVETLSKFVGSYHKFTATPDEYQLSNYKEFLMNWQVDFNFTNMNEVNDGAEL